VARFSRQGSRFFLIREEKLLLGSESVRPIPDETQVPRVARDDSEKKKIGKTEESKSLLEC
jgi:hypothetical protein